MTHSSRSQALLARNSLSRAGMLFVLVALALGIAYLGYLAFRGEEWHYVIESHARRTRLSFEEPDVSIVMEGVPPGPTGGHGPSEKRGIVPVSGLAFFGSKESSEPDHYVHRIVYRFGVATFEICDRTVIIENSGTVLTCEGNRFSIDDGVPLRLSISPSGEVTEITD